MWRLSSHPQSVLPRSAAGEIEAVAERETDGRVRSRLKAVADDLREH